MIGVGSALISLFLALVCYSLTLTAKRADENLLMICEQNQKIEEEKGKQEMVSKKKFNSEYKKMVKKYPLKEIWPSVTFNLTTNNINNLVKNYKSFIITGKKF